MSERPDRRAPAAEALANMVRSMARQAQQDGLPVQTIDARGVTAILEHMGFETAALKPVAPPLARIMVELAVLTSAAADHVVNDTSKHRADRL